MSLYAHGLNIGLGFDICELGLFVQIIIFYYFIFESVNLCTSTFLWLVCLFTNVYRFIICAFILSQRERKRHRVVRRAQSLCASSPFCRSFYLGRQMSVSLKIPQIIWGVKSTLRRLCQHKTWFELFILHTHLVCELLIICRFLFIYMYSIYLLLLLLHLFVLLLIFRSVCFFFLVNHKSKLLIYIQHLSHCIPL